MKKYAICVKYTIEGIVEVVAENKTEAIGLIKRDFGGVVAEIGHSTGLSEHPEDKGIVDWDIETTPTKVIYK